MERSLSRGIRSCSSSFRLRSPSLNSLRLRRIFDIFDHNGDGVITVDELTQALNHLGLDADRSEFDSLLASFVRPGNAGLTYDDFGALHQSINEALCQIEEGGDDTSNDAPKIVDQEESDLTEAFKVFDEDGDGYISAKELQVVLRKLGLPEGREIGRVEQMIVSVDRNDDGLVDFLEFKEMMRLNILGRSS